MAPTEFEVIENETGWAVVGELDADNAAELISTVTAVTDRTGDWELDLSGVTFIDSRGLGALITLSQHAVASNTTLSIHQASAPVTRLLELTSTADLFAHRTI